MEDSLAFQSQIFPGPPALQKTSLKKKNFLSILFGETKTYVCLQNGAFR